MKTLAEFSKALHIDKHDLDEENIRQPELVYHATEQLSLVNSRLAELVRTKATLTAEIADRLREASAESGEKKITEKAIEQQVRMDPAMRGINSNLLIAEKEVSQWTGMVEAMRARGRALDNLGRLYSSNYFERDNSGRREAVERQAEKVYEARAERGRARRSG